MSHQLTTAGGSSTLTVVGATRHGIEISSRPYTDGRTQALRWSEAYRAAGQGDQLLRSLYAGILAAGLRIYPGGIQRVRSVPYGAGRERFRRVIVLAADLPEHQRIIEVYTEPAAEWTDAPL